MTLPGRAATGFSNIRRSVLQCFAGFLLPLIILAVIPPACTNSLVPESPEAVTFGVIDVGQGLSQILVQGDRALLFDAGTDDPAHSWRTAWRKLGSPRIEAVVLSHRDQDHTGGLRFLDSTVDWSGRLVAGKWEDTAFIRSCCSNRKGAITISTLAQNDTLYFTDNCSIDCRWPPDRKPAEVPVADDAVNEYSLVFSINYRTTGVLLTGDIDSTVASAITATYKTALRADIVVVPHHGSASSNCPLFYGYVKPTTAIISVGEGNSYGHPAPSTLTLLADQGIVWLTTINEGTIIRRTAGYYWE